MVTFRYQRFSSGHGVILRPIANLEFLTKKGEWIACHPIIDSGADVSLIPLSFGRLLGLAMNQKNAQEIHGLGHQPIPIVYLPLEIRIGGFRLQAEFGWALIENVPPLLGRKDIFDFFHITFQQNRGKILFKKT